MAKTITSLHHKYIPKIRIEPINPIYEDRPYISGSIFGVSTTYKTDMVKCDGYTEIWDCKVCGQSSEFELHRDRIINN